MGIDRDPNYGGDVTSGSNPAQDQPGFDQDAAADTYPTRDATGANQGMDRGFGQADDPGLGQGPGYGTDVNQGSDQDPGHTTDANQAINLGPASGAGMDPGTGAGGGYGSTDYDQDRDAAGPGGGGGLGGAMQRGIGKAQEALGNMTNNPDMQQQGRDRQAQAGGQTGYGTPDTTDTSDPMNRGLTDDDTYGNP